MREIRHNESGESIIKVIDPNISAGKFIVEAIRALAPAEADRFYNLVRNGYYDNTKYDLCDGVNGNEVATLIMQPVRYVEHTGAA